MNKNLGEIQELAKVIFSCIGSEERAASAGILVSKEELTRKMVNNEYDSMPFILMLKISENEFYIIEKDDKGSWINQDGSVIY
jgi:hypothetical protein